MLHLPLVGAIPNIKKQAQQYAQYTQKRRQPLAQVPAVVAHTYMLGGLGSRGFTTAPLLAERLVCELTGEPMPMGQALLAALNPNRYVLREAKRDA